jgi:tRNA1Val (adenine37-N6)-methyltransferase
MGNNYFRFKHFTVEQHYAGLKVTTDACLFGAWTAHQLQNATGRLLDVGAGTGLLSLMLAQKFSGRIDAVEVDKGSADECRQNFGKSPWTDRLHVHHVPIQEFRPEVPFDFIVSNPPFFHNDLKSPSAARNAALHSDSLTLDQLFQHSFSILNPGGTFALLVSQRRSDEVNKLAGKFNVHISNETSVCQSPLKTPFRVMYRIINKAGSSSKSKDVIFIKKDNDKYSDEFVALLKDYYLYL